MKYKIIAQDQGIMLNIEKAILHATKKSEENII